MPSLSETTSQLFLGASDHYVSYKSIYCWALPEIQLDATFGQWTIQTKVGRTIFANTAVYGLLFRICSVKNAMSHQFLTICSQVRLSRERQLRWVENEAYQQITFLAVQSVDKQLVVLEQGSCDKLRTGGGVKRRRIARRSCTWKIFILHGPSPTADSHILSGG